MESVTQVIDVLFKFLACGFMAITISKERAMKSKLNDLENRLN